MKSNIKKRVGAAGGAAAGMAIGAAIGSIVPVIGTAIGTAVGGIVGTLGGGIAGDAITADEDKRKRNEEINREKEKTERLFQEELQKRDFSLSSIKFVVFLLIIGIATLFCLFNFR